LVVGFRFCYLGFRFTVPLFYDQPIKKNRFLPLSQSLYWRPPADQKASGLWVRDWLHSRSTRHGFPEVSPVSPIPRARAHLRSAGSKCHGLWDNQKPHATFAASGFLKHARQFTNWACVTGRVKTKKGEEYYDVPLFLVPLTFTRDSRENENNPRSQSREDGRTGLYKFVSLCVRKFSSERRPDLYWKERQYDALKTAVVDGKDTICVLPAEYGRSLSNRLPPYLHTVTDCVFLTTVVKRKLRCHWDENS